MIESIRCTIIREGIPDKFWPKILLAITHISKLLLTSLLHGLFFFKTLAQSLPNLQHLRILGSKVYVFIHKKEQNAKSAKWAPWGKCEILAGYDGGTIYHIYLHNKAKVICIKNLKIFENVDKKEDS